MHRSIASLTPVLLLALSCANARMPSASFEVQEPAAAPRFQTDVPIARAPFATVGLNWKHRLDQPYVYIEHVGDYRSIRSSFAALLSGAQSLNLQVDGPMFALYYDDPGVVAVEALRSRACLPVSAAPSAAGSLQYDVLPSTTVIYAVAAGNYADVPRVYPKMLEYLAGRGWTLSGPIREIYVNPEAAASQGELLTEVQMPWMPAGGG